MVVDKLLAAAAITPGQLSPETRSELDNWARSSLEASDFPTAPWHDAVINLCRAVESEMASTLGTQPGLEFLAVAARLELGAKAKRLQHLDGEAVQRLRASGVRAGMLKELSTLLGELASLRGPAAHASSRRITSEDAKRAERISARVLKHLHSSGS